MGGAGQWTESTDSAETLAARTIAILTCRRHKAAVYARRGCEDLDSRYRAMRRALRWARVDANGAPADIHQAILKLFPANARLHKALQAAIGSPFPSEFGRLATSVLNGWDKLPNEQRKLAEDDEDWIDGAMTAWPADLVAAAQDELRKTARLVFLFTNIWFLRRSARLLKLGDARDFPGMDFLAVLDEEMEEIECRRRVDSSAASAGDPLARADATKLAGLAFSGGGIRSATFNLGVLQHLGESGLLKEFDYLSTVSGGGYIGGWLHGWIHRDDEQAAKSGSEKKGIERVEECLALSLKADPHDTRVGPIQFLRRYSNYLTPKTGGLSADTWTMANIWLRNIFLNIMVLALALSAILLCPYWMAGGVFQTGSATLPQTVFYYWPLALMLPAVLIGINTRVLEVDGKGKGSASPYRLPRWLSNDNGVLALGVLPTVVASIGGGIQTIYAADHHHQRYFLAASVAEFGLLVAAFGLTTCATGRLDLHFYRDAAKGLAAAIRTVRSYMWILFTCVLAGVAAGGMYYLVAKRLPRPDHNLLRLQVLTWSVPIFAAMLALSICLVVGFLGRRMPDYRREWVARFGGWMGIHAIMWFALCALAAYSAPLMAWLEQGVHEALSGGVWLTTTIGGLFSSRSIAKSQAAGQKPSPVIGLLAKIAPPVFVLGLLLILSRVIGSFEFYKDTKGLVKQVDAPVETLLCTAAFGLTAWFLSTRFDINEFSLHPFYRNRLVRCYLGATRSAARNPNAFTGFDPRDDFRLMELAPSRGYSGPYPIFNTTLNVVHGDELAWQERKGEAFAFTPRFCGFNVDNGRATHPRTEGEPNLSYGGYRPTRDYAYPDHDDASQGSPSGVHVGTAMAISGAAASPNMGSQTATSLAFLMTVLGARLGWWLGNPRRNDAWQQPGPRIGLFHLLAELTANTNDTRRYVYLSDGGHFENLAIYELLRRRCRFIVACDSEQDGSYTFPGLGNLLRKCRTDFGVRIYLDLDKIKPKPGERKSETHFAAGRIVYPPHGGRPSEDGVLLYIKASLTGDEPADVFQHSLRNENYPHDSTADQWFDETTFESYRTLGVHVARFVFEQFRKARPEFAREGIFANAIWPEGPKELAQSAAGLAR